MTQVTKEKCDGCGRVFSKKSLVKWKNDLFCRTCRAQIPSYKIMYIKTHRSKEEIEEMEGRG